MQAPDFGFTENAAFPISMETTLKLKEGVKLPIEASLLLGCRGLGQILAKAVKGVTAFPRGSLVYLHSQAPLADIYVVDRETPGEDGPTFQKVIAISVKDPVQPAYCKEVVNGILLHIYKKYCIKEVFIFESLPWSVVTQMGHSAFSLGCESEEKNCINHFKGGEACGLETSLGSQLFKALHNEKVRYFLAITVENAENFSDLRELAKDIEKNLPGCHFVDNKLQSGLKSLQNSLYI